jgi:hypothetical protein
VTDDPINRQLKSHAIVARAKLDKRITNSFSGSSRTHIRCRLRQNGGVGTLFESEGCETASHLLVQFEVLVQLCFVIRISAIHDKGILITGYPYNESSLGAHLRKSRAIDVLPPRLPTLMG